MIDRRLTGRALKRDKCPRCGQWVSLTKDETDDSKTSYYICNNCELAFMVWDLK